MLIEIKSVKQSSLYQKQNKTKQNKKNPHPFHTVAIALSFHHQTLHFLYVHLIKSKAQFFTLTAIIEEYNIKIIPVLRRSD